MPYRIERKNKKYILMEDDVTINTYKSRKQANDVCRGLNLGKGFEGATPKFFTYSLGQYLSEVELKEI